MNPVSTAEKASSVIERHGDIGVVVLAACTLLIASWAIIVVLWRQLKTEQRRSREATQERYEWALKYLERNKDLEAQWATTLQSVVSSVQALRTFVELATQRSGSG